MNHFQVTGYSSCACIHLSRKVHIRSRQYSLFTGSRLKSNSRKAKQIIKLNVFMRSLKKCYERKCKIQQQKLKCKLDNQTVSVHFKGNWQFLFLIEYLCSNTHVGQPVQTGFIALALFCPYV